jgi:hypothetical protein
MLVSMRAASEPRGLNDVRSTWTGVVFGCLFVTACAAGAPPVAASAPASAAASGDFSVVVLGPGSKRVAFDTKSPRISAAYRELESLTKHPVRFEIDAALTTNLPETFESQLAQTVERASRAFARLGEFDTDAAPWGLAAVDVFAFRYSPSLARVELHMKEESRALEVLCPEWQWALVDERLLAGAIEDAFEAHLQASYATRPPSNVPPAERGLYFRALREARDKAPADGVSEPRAEKVLKVLELESLVGTTDAALGRRLRHWLLEERTHLFADGYLFHTPSIPRLAADSLFRRAEAAYVAWMKRDVPTMTDAEQLALAKDLFLRDRNRTGYVAIAFPGFDTVGFALGVVARWISAGHPDQRDSDRNNPTFEFIVCPRPVVAHSTVAGPNCEDDLARMAVDDPGVMKRLLFAIVERHDAPFTDYAFASLRIALYREREVPSATSKAALLAALAKVPGHEAVWSAAVRALGAPL